MNARTKGPGFLSGALVGLLLSAALAAVLFVAQRAVGAPFPPFDLFDWLARALPGPIVTFGIDAIVAVIVLFDLGAVSDVAKLAEQALAVALFVLAGAVAAGVVFALSRDGAGASRAIAWGAGAVLGLGAFAASRAVNATAAARPLISGAWILAAFLAWGAALAWSRARLAEAGAPAAADAPADPGAPRDAAPPAGADAPAKSGAEPRRPTSASVERLDRRRFLVRLGGATAAITVVGAGVGALLGRQDTEPAAAGTTEAQTWSQGNPLPNAGAEVSPAPGTRPELTPLEQHYRIDINTTPPRVDGASWRLRVDGLVDEPRELTLEELRAYEPVHRFVTLSCISNRLGGDLISTTRWTGVPLQRLLPDLGLRDEASHLRVSSVDGFFEIVPLETILIDERVMLAYAWDGLPLPQRNGYPLRIYVPDVYGMKQPKWIDRIEAIDGWEEGYWVERGWDAEARMRTTSVIDTVATDAVNRDADGARIPVGGIAHAGARGISRVEVRVDDGPWQEAELRRPLSGLTWVVWRFDWPFEEGRHTITVRCVDGDGTPQIEERNPVRPSGATGLVREDVTV